MDQKHRQTSFPLACIYGGILSCGITHTAITPIDFIKCNMQTNLNCFPSLYKGLTRVYSGALTKWGFSSGFRGIITGWGPTFIGYSLQGFGKYGGYELFKHSFSSLLDQDTTFRYRYLIYMLSSGLAETFADILLCPLETIKVRVQTYPSFSRGVLDGLPKIYNNEGFKSLFTSLPILWCRQIPYTIIKFTAFEGFSEYIYKHILHKNKNDCGWKINTPVILTSGCLAGFVCGISTQPFDTLVSKINKRKRVGPYHKIVKDIIYGTPTTEGIGIKGLFKGLGPRVLMISILTSLQWYIYSGVLHYFGHSPPG